jgi:hypothetical protein
MFSKAEGYILEELDQPPLWPVKPGAPVRLPPRADQTASQGATLLRPMFLPKMLRTVWEIGEHL